MVFSKPEGMGCSVPSAARVLVRTRGFTKYHRSHWIWMQSLACLGLWPVYLYQYVYLVQKFDNTVFSCTGVYRGYTTHSAVKKIVGSLLKNEGDY